MLSAYNVYRWDLIRKKKHTLKNNISSYASAQQRDRRRETEAFVHAVGTDIYEVLSFNTDYSRALHTPPLFSHPPSQKRLYIPALAFVFSSHHCVCVCVRLTWIGCERGHHWSVFQLNGVIISRTAVRIHIQLLHPLRSSTATQYIYTHSYRGLTFI